MSGDSKEIISEPDQGPVLYIHIYNSGEIFILPDDRTDGSISDSLRLKAELSRLSKIDGSILYSYDDPETFSDEASEVLDYIVEIELPAEFTLYPHPQVYGFDSSFALHLFHAVDYAEMDVEGLEVLLNSCEGYLRKLEAGSEEYKEVECDYRLLQAKLEKAKYSLEVLKEVSGELCSDEQEE